MFRARHLEGTHNGQVAENHDLRAVTGGIEEGAGDAVLVGNSDR